MEFPKTFFLYIDSRKSLADPYSGLILMKSMVVGSTTTPPHHVIWAAPHSPSITYTVKTHTFTPANGFNGSVNVAIPDSAIILNKRFSTSLSMYDSAMGPDGVIIPVLQMAKHTTLFGTTRLKRNVTITSMDLIGPPPLSLPVSLTLPGPSPVPVPVPSPPANTNTNTNIKVKKNIPGVTKLSIHVARQLLELAQMKKEMCPITVEEYSTGNTAVMPCGHLFLQFAIEETFKVAPGVCPACRQAGQPTYA